MRIDFKKTKTIIFFALGGIAAVLLLIGFIYLPLLNKYNSLSYEIRRVEKNIQLAQNFIDAQKILFEKKHLIDEKHIVDAIDQMTQMGKKNKVNFLSIKPKEIERLNHISYAVLPIEMIVKAEYKNLGLYLSDLRNLENNVIVVGKFNVVRKEEILPKVEAVIVVEVYLKNG